MQSPPAVRHYGELFPRLQNFRAHVLHFVFSIVYEGYRWWAQVARGEPRFTAITYRLVVGGRPRSVAHLPRGTTHVLDLTAETFAASDVLQSGVGFCKTPCWDTTLPDLDALKGCVRWAVKALESDPAAILYVHCGFGHSRSAVVTALILSRLRHTLNWRHEFERSVQACRPKAHFNWSQGIAADLCQASLRQDDSSCASVT